MPSWMKQKIIKGLAILRRRFKALKDAGVFLGMKNRILRGAAILRRRFRALKDAAASPEMKNRILKGAAIFRRKSRTLKGAAALPGKHEMKKAARVFLGNTVIRDITFFVAFVAAAALLLIIIPPLQVTGSITDPMQRFSAENEARKTLAQLIGGLVILVGVALGFRRVKAAEENVRVSQEGQITERFTRAVEQLGNGENIHIRLGGIYALERIARDSQKDHWTIMEVLTAFVRENAKRDKAAEETEEKETPKFPIDIQAALTVIGRREFAHEDKNTPFLDLSGTDLRGADLVGMNLAGADLHGVNLSGVNLSDTNFSGIRIGGVIYNAADLSGANLSGANLFGADLGGAFLGRADLSEAHLVMANIIMTRFDKANLRGAKFRAARINLTNFDGADLGDAYFEICDLRGAKNLTQEQIDSAKIHETTELPDYLKS